MNDYTITYIIDEAEYTVTVAAANRVAAFEVFASLFDADQEIQITEVKRCNND